MWPGIGNEAMAERADAGSHGRPKLRKGQRSREAWHVAGSPEADGEDWGDGPVINVASFFREFELLAKLYQSQADPKFGTQMQIADETTDVSGPFPFPKDSRTHHRFCP